MVLIRITLKITINFLWSWFPIHQSLLGMFYWISNCIDSVRHKIKYSLKKSIQHSFNPEASQEHLSSVQLLLFLPVVIPYFITTIISHVQLTAWLILNFRCRYQHFGAFFCYLTQSITKHFWWGSLPLFFFFFLQIVIKTYTESLNIIF